MSAESDGTPSESLDPDIAFEEEYYGGETRFTVVKTGETVDGKGQSVLVEQRWKTETHPDVVSLTGTRIETISEMLQEGADRREFEDRLGTDPVAGTTTVEVGEAAVVSQQLACEDVADVVTLTSRHLSRIKRALEANE